MIPGSNVPPFHSAGGCACTPGYVTGNRTASITLTVSASTLNGTASNLLNGDTNDDGTNYFANGLASGHFLKFDFGAGNSIKITEAKYYQSNTVSHGTWKWQGSDDDTAWTDIGVGFALGGAETQTQTELAGNTVGYRYYQLLGVSGSHSASPWVNEFEFNQCTC